VARSAGQISILQADRQRIQLLRVRPAAGELPVTGHVVEHGDWPDDDALREALTAFVQEHKLRDDQVYSVLPRHEMTTRTLLMPSHDEEEIRGMVRFSAEEYVPFPPEELVIDQTVLERLPDGNARVLAVFVHRDLVEQHVALLRDAGITPRRVLVSTACLGSIAHAARPGAEERYAVVNLASGGLEVVAMNGARLDYSRAVATHQDWTQLSPEGGEVFEELLVELRASLSAYRRESEEGLGVDKVYLSCGWADAGAVAGALTHEIGYECEPATFVDGLVTGEAPASLPLVAYGAALAAQGRAAFGLDVTPASVREARAHASTRQRVIAWAVLAVLIMGALAGLYGLAVYQRTRYVAELDERIARVEEAAREVSQMRRGLSRLQQFVDRGDTALELFADAVGLAPDGNEFSFMSFEYNAGRELRMEVRVRDLAVATRYVDALQAFGQQEGNVFAAARPGKTSTVQERNQEVTQFEIVVPFPQPEAGEEAAP
jgi:Tfp pilus assembly PilM family ATPase